MKSVIIIIRGLGIAEKIFFINNFKEDARCHNHFEMCRYGLLMHCEEMGNILFTEYPLLSFMLEERNWHDMDYYGYREPQIIICFAKGNLKNVNPKLYRESSVINLDEIETKFHGRKSDGSQKNYLSFLTPEISSIMGDASSIITITGAIITLCKKVYDRIKRHKESEQLDLLEDHDDLVPE